MRMSSRASGWRAAGFFVVVTTLVAAEIATAPLPTYKPIERRYWAFQPRKQATPPAFTDPADKAWVKTPIDAFILEKLKAAGLKPAAQADKATLIRRVTYDLIGLPPTPEEVDAFVKDNSPNAYEKLVDRLLASPQYGETWGHHWLDVVRFAESDGYEYDMHRPDAYRYRDYVVKSFNDDKPYNQFVKEQLAGDEMDMKNETYVVASGFNRLGPLRKNAGNQNVASSRTEVLTEMTNIVGAAYLGVTVACSRCHDHKFDPFRQSDYYRLQAYFAQTKENDIVMASTEEQAKYKEKVTPLQTEMRRLQMQLGRAPEAQKADLEKKLEELDEQMPPPITSLYGVKNDTADTNPIRILSRGEYLDPKDKVGMRPPGVFLPDDAPELPTGTANPRTKLADWLIDPNNPLTARVMVNRIWQYNFGRGIVSTANDFGVMGSRPSHPELLDWLANQFVDNGWHTKPLTKMMLMSSTYQQASHSPLEKVVTEKDADNALLWKFNRRRLEAEELRDSMLAVAGRLNTKIGGPSVMTPIPDELVKMLKRPQYWAATKDKNEYNRRSIYMIYKRNLILPFMQTFDEPDTLSSCGRRDQSTHAPQALELLNGELSNSLAVSLADRLLKMDTTNSARVDEAFRLAAGRLPTAKEKALAMTYLTGKVNDQAAMKEFALAMFNLNAFLYVN